MPEGQFFTLAAKPLRVTKGAKRSLHKHMHKLMREAESKLGFMEWGTNSNVYNIGLSMVLFIKKLKRKVKRRGGTAITCDDVLSVTN